MLDRMDEVAIRPETAGDVEAVLDVFEAVGAEARWIGTEVPFDRTAKADGIRASLGRPETCGAFVAEVGAQEVDAAVIGFIGLELMPYGVVDFGMALLDGHRSQGIGLRLMEAGIGWARKSGAHKMSLQVWPSNQRAIGLYTKVGFTEEGRLRQHYRRQSGELWDAVIMGLIFSE